MKLYKGIGVTVPPIRFILKGVMDQFKQAWAAGLICPTLTNFLKYARVCIPAGCNPISIYYQSTSTHSSVWPVVMQWAFNELDLGLLIIVEMYVQSGQLNIWLEQETPAFGVLIHFPQQIVATNICPLPKWFLQQ